MNDNVKVNEKEVGAFNEIQIDVLVIAI